MKFYALLVAMLGSLIFLNGISVSAKNQISATGFGYLQDTKEKSEIIGLWQPELNLNLVLKNNYQVMLQSMGTCKGDYVFQSDDDKSDFKVKLYRLWLKAGTPQTDIRLGLQRLNFGSAQILRPLQWFDNLDPRDKLEQTEGVQAALISHYFLNNANIWLWGIRGEGKTRGLMFTATKENSPEWGGRLQYPVSNGEIALAFNHREKTEFMQSDTGSDNRLGFDARLDYGVGIWCEGFISSQHSHHLLPRRVVPVTIGTDYTISIGNGIYTLLEAQVWYQSEDIANDLKAKYSAYAFTANYPIGLLDKIAYYGIIKDDNTSSVHSIIWRREYDHLGMETGFFWDAGTLHKSYNSRGVKLQATYTF